MLPEKFFNSRVRLTIVCPETALMYAVLEDAFLCFQKRFDMEGQLSLEARQAEQWLFCNDSDCAFSFVSICDALGLQPQFIRTKFRHWAEIKGK